MCKRLKKSPSYVTMGNCLHTLFIFMSHATAKQDHQQESCHRPLFRAQAVEHVTVRQYGAVILTNPVSHRVLTTVFVTIALGIIAFFCLFSTIRKAGGQGVLLPTAGVIRVTPVQAGVIVEKYVKQGQAIKAGQPMFLVSGERGSAGAGSAEKKISVLLERQLVSLRGELQQSQIQAAQRIAAARRRIEDTSAERVHVLNQVSLQKRRVALAEQAFKRYGDLEATRYISPAQLQDKQAELLDQRQRLADLERTYAAKGRDLSTAQAELGDLQVQAQRDTSALERNLSALEQNLAENEARRETLIRAPLDGTVAAIAAEVGQTATVNSTLASVLPKGAQLEAEIFVPSRSVGFVKPGMLVLLRYQAYPYQKFGQYRSHVREIADTSLLPQELGLPQTISAEPLYRIRLTLESQKIMAYGKQLPLKSGMLVDASIHLEHRRLYEWILEPLFSISGRG
jgi:membrane fusion protein